MEDSTDDIREGGKEGRRGRRKEERKEKGKGRRLGDRLDFCMPMGTAKLTTSKLRGRREREYTKLH